MLKKSEIPNLLTFFRVAAMVVVLVVAALFPAYRAVILWLFIAASITDFLDGYLARKWSTVSPLGTMLDPIADKLLVATVLVYLLKFTSAPVGAVAVIICREIYIAGLREFLAARHIALPVSKGGKWKTALQLTALILLLAAITYPMPYALIQGTYLITVWNIGMILLWISAVLSLVSAFHYTRSAFTKI